MIEKVASNRSAAVEIYAPDHPAAAALLYRATQLQKLRETTFTRSGYSK